MKKPKIDKIEKLIGEVVDYVGKYQITKQSSTDQKINEIIGKVNIIIDLINDSPLAVKKDSPLVK